MNFRRGFFRVWVAISLLWLCGIGAVSGPAVHKEFQASRLNADIKTFKLLLPVRCAETRGEANKDYTTIQYSEPGPWEKYATCWYQVEDFRRLYPEYADLGVEALSDKLYDGAGISRKRTDPWGMLRQTLLVVALPIVALFALGYVLIWVGAGFSFRPNN